MIVQSQETARLNRRIANLQKLMTQQERREAAQAAKQRQRRYELLRRWAAVEADPPVPLPDTDWAAVVREVAARRRVSTDAIMGRQRHRFIVLARHEAWWRVRTELGMKFAAMAAVFRVDHSTVIYAVGKTAVKMRARRVAG